MNVQEMLLRGGSLNQKLLGAEMTDGQATETALSASDEESVMLAILSDIHANLEALQAVLEDIHRFRVDSIYCLGDLIGYGPNPRECLDLVRMWKIVLMGNIDLAAIGDPPDLGPTAITLNRSLVWTRRQLIAAEPDRQTADDRWQFLVGRPHSHREGDFLFVHGSPRNPLYEYVFPEDVYNERKLSGIFAEVDRYCFQGHTHIPGVFSEDRRFLNPGEINSLYRLAGHKTLINVGSVGQSRDGDWRAGYVLFDGESIRFRRVEYDIDTTIQKIRAIDDLDDWSGDRLGNGQ